MIRGKLSLLIPLLSPLEGTPWSQQLSSSPREIEPLPNPLLSQQGTLSQVAAELIGWENILQKTEVQGLFRLPPSVLMAGQP